MQSIPTILKLLLSLAIISSSQQFSPPSINPTRRQILQTTTMPLIAPLLPQEKPVCIIGANGETGRECVRLLTENKKLVRAVSYKSSKEDPSKYIQSIQADIRDPAKISEIIKGVSSVIFLANAKKKYRYIKTDTEQFQNYEDIDITALQNVAKACIKHSIPRLLFVSGTCKSCLNNPDAEIDKICGIECDNCRTKQAGENIIRRLYAGVKDADYTIVRIGYLFNGENRGPSEIEINQDFTKSGMISRTDLANICINTVNNPLTARTTFEAYYRDTTQPYDVKDSLQMCTNLGKSVEECFFGSAYKNKKPKSMEEVRKQPIKGSLFTTGNEYQGSDWYDLFKDVKKDSVNKYLYNNQVQEMQDDTGVPDFRGIQTT